MRGPSGLAVPCGRTVSKTVCRACNISDLSPCEMLRSMLPIFHLTEDSQSAAFRRGDGGACMTRFLKNNFPERCGRGREGTHGRKTARSVCSLRSFAAGNSHRRGIYAGWRGCLQWWGHCGKVRRFANRRPSEPLRTAFSPALSSGSARPGSTRQIAGGPGDAISLCSLYLGSPARSGGMWSTPRPRQIFRNE